MQYLFLQELEIKPDIRSVDPCKTSPLNRVAFATDLAS